MSVYQDEIDLQDECASPQMAMIVNDHAAFCIEIGFFEEAISTLATALEMTEPLPGKSSVGSCCECNDCTLESCIAFSRKFSKLTQKQKSLLRGSTAEVSRKEHGGDFVWPAIATDDGKVYSHPIRVPREPMEEGHAMSFSIVQLILTFNLALALHLQVLLRSKNHEQSDEEDIDDCFEYNIEDARDLYNEIFKWKRDEVNGGLQNSCLKKIISNNLGVTICSIARKNSLTQLSSAVQKETALLG